MDAVTLAGEIRKLATNASRHALMQIETGPHWASQEAAQSNHAELHRQYLELVEANAVDAQYRIGVGEPADKVYEAIREGLRSREWYTTGLLFGVFVSTTAIMGICRLLDAVLTAPSNEDAAGRMSELALSCTLTDVRRRVKELACKPSSARPRETPSTPTSLRKSA